MRKKIFFLYNTIDLKVLVSAGNVSLNIKDSLPKMMGVSSGNDQISKVSCNLLGISIEMKNIAEKERENTQFGDMK